MAASSVQKYARALYEALAGKILEQLRAVAPRIEGIEAGKQDMTKQIEAVLPEGTLPEVRNFLFVLARDGSLNKLPSILNALELYEKGETASLMDAEVTSAVPLSTSQKNRITKKLRQRYDSELNLSFKVDETLIGGLIIRVGDQVLDNSLRTRLGAIQRNMQFS